MDNKYTAYAPFPIRCTMLDSHFSFGCGGATDLAFPVDIETQARKAFIKTFPPYLSDSTIKSFHLLKLRADDIFRRFEAQSK